ncbi:hypothetical protein [Pseudomonas canadensis]|uniref:hypothetical protein n=1 Tax=Pseudomonas canadensis TaxID=915099 RepID=UPI001F3FE120|nr:hypothetical protein [Pseudomonas canadensis]MCF5172034.1 hypothetical protein [Pseudomonas canadensis]
MSQPINELTGYADYNATPEAKRVKAVAAALTSIQAKVANAPSNSTILSDEMSKLSTYADQIQEALKVK